MREGTCKRQFIRCRQSTRAVDEWLLMELCLIVSWIRDATILRWPEQTVIFAKGAVKASMVMDQLLPAPDQGRKVHDAKGYFQSLVSRPCVWSHKELGVGNVAVEAINRIT